MKSLVNFFVEIGKLRNCPRRGGVLIGAKNPATITDHLFRVALMAWILAKEKNANLNIKKILEMSLVHDLCELYAGDASPYDHGRLLKENKGRWSELFDRWPRLTPGQKKNKSALKHRREKAAFKKLLKGLSIKARNEIFANWQEYENGLSREARFVKQINRLETLLQALEYGRQEGIRVYDSWWIGSKERIDDPLLLKFMDSLAEDFKK